MNVRSETVNAVESVIKRAIAGFAFFVATNVAAAADTAALLNLDDLPPSVRRLYSPATEETNPSARDLFRGGSTDWAAVIDSTWGPAPWSLTTQLIWFDRLWDKIDQSYACWEGIEDNWDSLRTVYEPEINAGVSKGRFAAIMNHLALAVQESHTRAELRSVNQNTALEPGIPLLYVGPWGPNGHFGAALTPLPDGSLLVYDAVSSHPLGLVPGDVVLGYEGRSWNEWYPELLDAQLPLTGLGWGSSPSSYAHAFEMSAGMNWHLFESIDVVKYGTGDTLNLSVAPLVGATMDIFGREQLPVAGVPMPDFESAEVVTWGVVSGTSIGYIYVYGWFGDAETAFLDAVSSLMETEGLIIDFRFNAGGSMFLSDPALALLFDETVPTINWSERCNFIDHLAMCPAGTDSTDYDIPGDPAFFYDKPIAVLVGPGAVSSGDQVALRMKFHPKARLFGKPTSSAFNSPLDLSIGNPWDARYAAWDAYLLSDPGNHLTHDEFMVDEEIWLDRDDVALGVDTVVEAALAWIQSEVVTGVPDRAEANQPTLSNSPNPFSSRTTIHYSSVGSRAVDIAVFDVAGRLVRVLENRQAPRGPGMVTWDGRNDSGVRVSDGTYFVRLRTDGVTRTRKVVCLGGG